jgi:hypothetical protein
LAASVLAVVLVGGLKIRAFSAGSTTPAPVPAASPLNDTWKGTTLDPNWHVTILGDAQDQEHSIKLDNGLLRLTAGGSDIFGKSDNGMYIWQPANGDFQVTLEMHNIAFTSASAKCGIMVRASLDTTSRYAAEFSMPWGGFLESRLTPAAAPPNGSGCPGPECVAWGDPNAEDPSRPVILLRLTRKGDVFMAERSADGGKTWGHLRTGSLQGRDTIAVKLGDDVLVGIAYTSRNSSQTGEAVVGPITFTQLATRPTGNGLLAATATDASGQPVAEVGLIVKSGSDKLGTSVGAAITSNTASFFLKPGTYTVEAAETGTYKAGTPVPFEIKFGQVQELKVKVGDKKQ